MLEFRNAQLSSEVVVADKKRTKILHTIIGVVLALVILPLSIVAWQLVDINRDAMRSAERRAQLQTIQDVGNHVETFVGGHRNEVVAIAQTMETSNGLSALLGLPEEERSQRLSRFLKKNDNMMLLAFIPALSATDPAGTVRILDGTRISNAEADKIVGDSVAFLRKSPERTLTSQPLTIPSSQEFAVTFAEPIAGREGEQGAVVAVVSFEPVFRFVNQFGGSGTNAALLKAGSRIVFLVNQEGRVLIHPDREMVYSSRTVKDWEIVKRWTENQRIASAEQFELPLEGTTFSMLGSFTTTQLSPDIKLGVIAVINEKMAYSSVGQMITRAVTLSLVTVILGVGIGVALSFWVTSPIQSLAGGARAIAAGDFSKRITVRTSTEIGQLAEDFNSMAEQIQRYINDLKFAANENRQLFLGTVRALAEAIDGKDPYTRGHSERVMQYSVLIAQYMGLNDDEVEDIRIASILHDVGKIGIEDRILKKPAALTEDEYTVMKGHPQKGANIMSQIPQMKKYVPGMYYHHECMDGKGYPLGLKGDQIPMMARIISVADTFDAMTTNRPYQRAMEPDFAVQRIHTFSGTRYDPVVVKALEDSLKAGRLTEVIQGYQVSQMAGKP